MTVMLSRWCGQVLRTNKWITTAKVSEASRFTGFLFLCFWLNCSKIFVISFVMKKHQHFTPSSYYFIPCFSFTLLSHFPVEQHVTQRWSLCANARCWAHRWRDEDGPFIHLLLWGLMPGLRGDKWQKPTVSLKWPCSTFQPDSILTL